MNVLACRRHIAVLAAGCVAGSSFASGADSGAALDTAPTTGWHSLDESTARLKLVQVVFRHGARTPLTSYSQFWKHDPEWNVCGSSPSSKSPARLSIVSTQGEPSPVSEHNLKQMARKMPGNCFAGELTQLGHQKGFNLGDELRRRYIKELGFLKPEFQRDAISCRTTNYDRTIKTLACVLSGLYPGYEEPIPAVTSSDVDEILFADTKTCPHLGTFMQLSKQACRELVLRDPECAWARAELKRVLGLGDEFFSRTWAITDVHDSMTSMRAHGKKLPEGMTDHLLAVVNRLATREFSAFVAPSINDDRGKAVMRLSMGVLLHTLVTNMEKKVADGQGPTLYLYSGHDSTIMPLLAALGLDLTHWPPYLSNLVFELWELPTGQHVVQVKYNLHDLQIPHCPPGKQPSLATFTREVVGPFILSASEWGAACQVQVTHDEALPQPVSVSSIVDGDD